LHVVDILKSLKIIIPVINDLSAGVIKLGDLVNTVSRAPTIEEF
jgi:hypothetical protein